MLVVEDRMFCWITAMLAMDDFSLCRQQARGSAEEAEQAAVQPGKNLVDQRLRATYALNAGKHVHQHRRGIILARQPE